MLEVHVDTLLKLNRLNDFNIRTGQILLIGWLRPVDRTAQPADPLSEQLFLPQPIFITDSAILAETRDKHYTTQKGVAWWNKAKPDPHLFVLHRKAPINSLIEIRNPMFGRSVWAKVVGTIPPTYSDDIAVIVSQGVARSLGAIDGRFYVEVNYEVR